MWELCAKQAETVVYSQGSTISRCPSCNKRDLKLVDWPEPTAMDVVNDLYPLPDTSVPWHFGQSDPIPCQDYLSPRSRGNTGAGGGISPAKMSPAAESLSKYRIAK